MVRFSCFIAHIGNQKPKKTVQPSFEAMHTTLEGFSQVQAPKESIKATNMASFLPEVETTEEIHNSVKPVTDSSSLDHSWKSVETKDNNNLDSSSRVLQNSHRLQKSRSLGSRLCREGRVPGQNDTDEETDQGFSSDSHDHGLLEDGRKNTVESQNGPCSESVQVSSHHNLAFSVGDPQLSEKDGHDISNLPFHCGHANGSGNDTSSAHAIVKSSSMPNILASVLIFEGHSPSKYLTHSTRSSEDVHVLNMRRKENLINDVDSEVMREQERDDGMHKNHKTHFESPYEGFESYSCSASAKDWIVPVSDEVHTVKILQEELRVLNRNDLTGNDFKIKRIEDWVNDLQHVCPLEDTFEISHPKDPVKVEPTTASNGLTAAKVGVMETSCMDAAKRYMSSLSASATTAQLVNHGLVVIPFLSAFVSLKVLNLSGNAIAKISAGALPRGLHMLNLSRNNISTIEGLRELTRLRVLNLSYNRILRIGHGLASCSSLKELYLAGNKISEVEGLHRLLKLTVLDLRFNKISTAKCLGQLAANYNSLQAISLEGNPAQKNVGDENLKKHLQGLLPNLVYFNRQAFKVSAMKDGAERSVRLGISGHQFERGLRSENRARKKNHGTSTRRPSSSSTHGHKSQAVASPMQSRGRHGRHPPPSGMKVATNHQNHYGDLGTKLLKFKPGLSMRRTQSEGTLEHL